MIFFVYEENKSAALLLSSSPSPSLFYSPRTLKEKAVSVDQSNKIML